MMRIDYNIPIATLIHNDGSFEELNQNYLPIHINHIHKNFEIWNMYDKNGNHIESKSNRGLAINYHYNYDILDSIEMKINHDSIYINHYMLRHINGKRFKTLYHHGKTIPVNDIKMLVFFDDRYVIYRKN